MSDCIIQPNRDVVVSKNSITRNMIDDAYRRGRADRIEEEKTVLDIYVPKDNICCKEAYCRGRAEAIEEIIKALSIFNDKKNGNEHFIFGIETAKEIAEQLKR